MRLLLVEDEQRLAENLKITLQRAGFAVDHAADGVTASLMAEQGQFDVIVLDLMLPDKSGQAVLRDLRFKQLKTPVLVLTALESKGSVIELLNAGADDYLAKPFDLGELIARAKALVRRSCGVTTSKLQVGDVVLDTVQQTISREDYIIDVSPTEYRIFEYLALRPRTVVSKRELLESLYDFTWEHYSNVIEVHISNLRRKIDSPNDESTIQTVRNRGYRLRMRSIA